MKLSTHAFRTFWDVHAWAGVTTALILHVMFFMGVFALFHEELEVWQSRGTPLERGAPPRSLDALVAPVLARPDVSPKRVGVYGLDEEGPLEVWYHPVVAGRPGPTQDRLQIDRHTGEVAAPRSALGGFLYGLHFLWHDAVPWLYYVAGLLAVALLLALTTGVLIQLKDFVRQLDQFRPRARLRVMWSDLHKVLGVFGLPFALLFAFTGVILCLAPFMSRPFVGVVFSAQSEIEALFGAPMPPTEAPPTPGAHALGFEAILAQAHAAFPGARVREVTLFDRGSAAGRARVSFGEEGVFNGRARAYFSLADGCLLSQARPGTPQESLTAATTRWLYGLHFARFGGYGMRFVLALLALGTCLVLLTGNWIWLCRRQAKQKGRGNELLARLTLVFGAGVVVATAAIFWANRLLPWDLPARAAWEERIFFAAWGLAGGLMLVRLAGRGAWAFWLRLSGVGFAIVPGLSVLSAEAHVLNLFRGQAGAQMGTELALFVFGLSLAGVGWRLGRPARVPGQGAPLARVGVMQEVTHV